MPTKPQQHVYVRRAGYGYGAEGEVDQGQVLTLVGAPNDERLVRLGYLERLPEGAHPVQCGVCARWFLDDRYRTRHGDRRHGRRAGEALEVGEAGGHDPTGRAVGALVDTTGDREEREMERDAPLYLEKTAASQKG
jgi:hypothetical protein